MTMMKTECTSIGLSLILLVGSAARGDESSLASYRAVYEKEAARIESEAAEAQKADHARYLASLDKAIASLKEAGNLDALLAVRAEKTRFEQGEPDQEDERLPQFIAEGRSKYQTQVRDNEQAANGRRILLLDQYVRGLKQLIVELTRADKIREAVAVKDEISKIEFIRADIMSTMPSMSDGAKDDSEAMRRPADARHFGGHWYKAVFEKGSWKQAKQRCEEMGGYLACVGSAFENRFVARLAAGRTVHVGGTDEGTTGKWRWVSGDDMTYTNWGPGIPDGVGHQHYLRIRSDGKWDDVHDPYPADGFVCEWDK